jgi:hypothetical protein
VGPICHINSWGYEIRAIAGVEIEKHNPRKLGEPLLSKIGAPNRAISSKPANTTGCFLSATGAPDPSRAGGKKEHPSPRVDPFCRNPCTSDGLGWAYPNHKGGWVAFAAKSNPKTKFCCEE